LNAPDENWNPPEAAAWIDEDRAETIARSHRTPRQSGDVSSSNNNNGNGGQGNGGNSPNRKHKHKNNNNNNNNDTAPPLEECAPLSVNEETRWKAAVFDESDEEILKQALLILNKLSLTKFDKLSDAFLTSGICRSEECVKEALSLVVNKAQV